MWVQEGFLQHWKTTLWSPKHREMRMCAGACSEPKCPWQSVHCSPGGHREPERLRPVPSHGHPRTQAAATAGTTTAEPSCSLPQLPYQLGGGEGSSREQFPVFPAVFLHWQGATPLQKHSEPPKGFPVHIPAALSRKGWLRLRSPTEAGSDAGICLSHLLLPSVQEMAVWTGAGLQAAHRSSNQVTPAACRDLHLILSLAL